MTIMKVKKGTKSISKKKQKRHTFEKKMSTCGKQKNNDVNYCNKCIKCLFRISTEKSEKKNKHINCSSSCCYIEVISTTDNISTQVINEFDFTFNPEFDVTTDFGDKTPAFRPAFDDNNIPINYDSDEEIGIPSAQPDPTSLNYLNEISEEWEIRKTLEHLCFDILF